MFDQFDEYMKWAEESEYVHINHTLDDEMILRLEIDGRSELVATPDDWLDTYLWIKSIKETLKYEV